MADLRQRYADMIDVSFFRHHRLVEHRDGTSAFKLAPLKKSIYSLHTLRELMLAANATATG